jgi:Xaa-Pro aminopeptidase
LEVIAIKMVGIAVRIEDDILITANGPKFVGRSTLKSDAIEQHARKKYV